MMITKEAKARIAAHSLQEQLEQCRKQMQRECAEAARMDDAQVKPDNWQTRLKEHTDE